MVVAAYVTLAILFYWIGGDQLRYRDISSDMLTASNPVGEITKDTVLTQQISVEGEELASLTFRGGTYARQNSGNLAIEVCSDGQVLASQSFDISAMADNAEFNISFEPTVELPNHTAELRITAPECVPGNAVTLYSGNTMSTVRNQVTVQLSETERVYVNGTAMDGALLSLIHI